VTEERRQLDATPAISFTPDPACFEFLAVCFSSWGEPAQALAYKLGSNEMLRLRAEAQKKMGKDFDIRKFHAWILDSGPMQLEVLDQHVHWCIEQATKEKRAQ
jgi:Bacterial protein of unknown function (DUF885)